MDTIRKTAVIAKLTIEENIRKKILYILLFVSFALIAFSSSMTSFNLGAQVTVMKDISLSGISLFGVIFTLSLFLNVIPREIETKTIYPFLAQPITRGTYLTGKFLGLFFLVAAYLLFLGAELIIVLKFFEETWSWNIMHSIVLNIIQCGLLGALMLFFSLITSYPLAISVTILLYILGGISSPYVRYLSTTFPPVFTKLIIAVKLIIPKFDVFNVKDAVVHGTPLLPDYFLSSIIYGTAFIMVIMILAIMIFEKKDL